MGPGRPAPAPAVPAALAWAPALAALAALAGLLRCRPPLASHQGLVLDRDHVRRRLPSADEPPRPSHQRACAFGLSRAWAARAVLS